MLQGYVATGEIDETFIPIALRFPECGYAETRWSGDLYSMSDADFVAAVEAARPCFLALVAAGTIDEYELPTEIAHLECFEGRNWYNMFDDRSTTPATTPASTPPTPPDGSRPASRP